ncbi:uncharacterized protein K452DRAFT_300062 [Aplosporella prunicola CBS 121167]|uniref:Uncharacterized protein n=1 Tax=Aplosporella prunicola CBS 121167 TaxID=1176127 RepID=A0A6A6B659_9PEZI|nr:uncharacterized protein K452DRAFT_300062 [Aplosporella prunicola CBS 121167]KAF2139500.1 hypothetical protein K452DRAFT_300062 [Aplosporella prunicola CBS 121167]
MVQPVSYALTLTDPFQTRIDAELTIERRLRKKKAIRDGRTADEIRDIAVYMKAYREGRKAAMTEADKAEHRRKEAQRWRETRAKWSPETRASKNRQSQVRKRFVREESNKDPEKRAARLAQQRLDTAKWKAKRDPGEVMHNAKMRMRKHRASKKEKKVQEERAKHKGTWDAFLIKG